MSPSSVHGRSRAVRASGTICLSCRIFGSVGAHLPALDFMNTCNIEPGETMGSAPVAVGIDGSKWALRAAFWAADEAISRDTSLRLIHVIGGARDDDDEDALARARHVLHAAWEGVAATGKPVKLESEILYGAAAEALVRASAHCSLLCLGHRGRTTLRLGIAVPQSAPSFARRIRRWRLCDAGPTAATPRTTTGSWWSSTTPRSLEVFQTAFDEAILRRAPLLVLTERVAASAPPGDVDGNLRSRLDDFIEQTRGHPADVQVCSLPMPHDFLNLLRQSASIDQLVVVGEGRAHLVEELTSATARKILHKSWCSVLVVRGRNANHSTAARDGDAEGH